jgi:hypothetical protein
MQSLFALKEANCPRIARPISDSNPVDFTRVSCNALARLLETTKR